MDKYLVANILVWMAIIALGWQMHTKQRPCKLTLRGGFIFFVLSLYWGAMMGLPPYRTSRNGSRYEWEAFVFVLIMSALIGGVLYLITKWIRVTWVRLVILAAIVITASLNFNWPFYYFPGMSGRVVDMDTGSPIKDAVVRVDLVTATGGLGGTTRGPRRITSTISDKDGNYRIPRSLDVIFLPLTQMDSLDLVAMHILTAQTTKHMGLPGIKLVHEDIRLMNARKYFEASHANRSVPAGVGFGNEYEPEFIVKTMLQNGVSKETIRSYYDDIQKARKAVYGENDRSAFNWQPKEEWFR